MGSTAEDLVQSEIKVMIDALPYVDPEFSIPGMREYVDQLVAAEMRKMPKKDYLHDRPLAEFSFKDPLLAAEFERVKAGKPMQFVETDRSVIEDPPASKQSDPEAWKKAVDDSSVQLEHQTNRVLNLELLQKFGGNAWRVHNFQVEGFVKLLEAELADAQWEVNEINKKRKAAQMEAYTTLTSLHSRLYDLRGASFRVQGACAQLEAEVEELRKKVKTTENPTAEATNQSG